MKKEKIIEQIDELKQKIEELEKKVNSPEFEGIKKGIRQMPETDEYYYYIHSCGIIVHGKWVNSEADLFRFNSGNCFKTEQEAEEYKENLLIKQQLKDLALELNNGAEIDWENTRQNKHIITSSNDFKTLNTFATSYHKDLGQIYCLDNQFLAIAEERIGEEKLIKLIESGV